MKYRKLFLLFLLTFLPSALKANSIWFELEPGAVWQTSNDVEIPYGSGTMFSLADFDTGPFVAIRAYLGANLGRHNIRLLYAPLKITVSGQPSSDISFQNETFLQGRDTTGTYMFNSYRLTYSFTLVQTKLFNLNIGATAKIRDAEIALTQGSTEAHRTNVGFVPLLNLGMEFILTPKWSIVFDLDGLVSEYGRAEDGSLKIVYSPDQYISFSLGYRTVEGGSDGGGLVYNFAWLHYAVFSMRYNFILDK